MKILQLVYLFVFLLELSSGQDDHIDPFDMVNFDPSTKTMKKKVPLDKPKEPEKLSKEPINSDKEEKEEPKTNPVYTSTTASPKVVTSKPEKPTEKNIGAVLFRNFVKKFISYFERKAPISTEEYHIWVKLSKEDYTVLQKFANGQSNVHDVQEILVSMITDVTRSNVGTSGKLSMWFEEKTGASLDSILKMVVILSLISMILYMEIGLHVSWRRRVTQVIMLAFVISIPMTWYELYQSAQINQQTVTMKEAPKECVQDLDEGDWLSVYTSAFKGLFTLQKDNCQQYYEHMLIDPFLKVTPTKAIAVTFVRFFLSPLKDVGTAFSEFMRALLIDLPVTLYPVAIATLSIFLFLFLFMWFGYSIRLPFFLSVEPVPRVAIGGTAVDNTQAIEGVKKQLETLQESIQNSETKMVDQLRMMTENQTKALEYTASVMTNNVPPPTLPLQSALTHNRSSDISFESSQETEEKTPIPCSDDSFSVVEDLTVHQEHSTKVVQETTSRVDNIGPTT